MRTLRTVVACALIGASITALTSLFAQQPAAPRIEIVEPRSEALMAGPVTLRATVTSGGVRVVAIEFFVDGSASPSCRVSQEPFECVYDAGERVVAHTIRAVATLADGSRLATSVVTGQGYTERAEVNAVLVSAVVTDRRGRAVQGLTKDAFRIVDNGQAQTITFLATEAVPTDIVLVVDTSGSMKDSLPIVKAAMKEFLTTARARGPQTYVTVLGFDKRTFVVARRNSPLREQLAGVDAMGQGGASSIFDAILTSLDAFGKEVSRKAVIVFTDGDDRNSLAPITAVPNRLRQSDATLYVVTHGKASETENARRAVRQLAAISGGRPIPIDDAKGLKSALLSILEDLTNTYLMGYVPASPPPIGEFRPIRVEVVSSGQRVRARDGYAIAPPKE